MPRSLLPALILAATVVVSVPADAADPHPPAKKEPARPAATPPAAVKSAAPPPAPAPAAPRPANLNELSERIQQRVAEVLKADKPKTAPPTRAAAPRRAPRVRVVWRASVVWPAALREGSGTATSPEEQVSLSWQTVAP